MPRKNPSSVTLSEYQIACLIKDYKSHRSYSPTGLSAIARKYGISRQRCYYYIKKYSKKGDSNG